MKLVYSEEYALVREAYFREKQVQNWSRKKREALIKGEFRDLPMLSKKDFTKRKGNKKIPSPLVE